MLGTYQIRCEDCNYEGSGMDAYRMGTESKAHAQEFGHTLTLKCLTTERELTVEGS